MSRHTLLAVISLLSLPMLAADPKRPEVAYIDPAAAAADPDFSLQGEYSGDVKGEKRGVQVIALGGGKFHAVGYEGGLPGDGWDKSKKKWEADGELKDAAVTFTSEMGTGVVKEGVLQVNSNAGEVIGQLRKRNRQSPTLGAKPPQGATVLFDGKTNDFAPGKTDGDLLIEGQNSKTKFQSVTLHIEFLLPYKPSARGQGRGNSGVYLQGRYECQVLDSFGLEGKNNECGGIYSIKAPDLNMCFPPLVWQTYDIDFTAAKFDDAGKKTKNATITVKHNATLIHDNVELPKSTTAAPVKEGPEPGPLHLQNHGNPVRYRNVWMVEKK